jgi:hypothetical protein
MDALQVDDLKSELDSRGGTPVSASAPRLPRIASQSPIGFVGPVRRVARDRRSVSLLVALAAFSAAFSAAAAMAARADVAGGELYGYRLGEIVEGCGQPNGQLGWTLVPSRSLPAPFAETWALCTPLTHEVLSISARARTEATAGATLVDELVAILDGKYAGQKGWKHDAQSRELLGSFDSIHTFENAEVLLRVSKRSEPAGNASGRSTIVEVQLDRSTLKPRRDLNERAEKERLEILRQRAKAKGLDKGL